VGKAARYVQLPSRLGIKPHHDMPAEGRRRTAQIDSHIDNRAFGNAHELGLRGIAGLIMQTADNPATGYRLVVLHKMRPAACGSLEQILPEGFAEISARIAMAPRLYYPYALKARSYKFHKANLQKNAHTRIFNVSLPAHTSDMFENKSDIGLREAQQTVDEWIRTVGVRYFSPLTNMAVLAEEVGEVARIIARTDGDQSAKPGEKLDLADELADVLWVTMAIANQHGIDLAGAFSNNYSKKCVRDKDRHINNPKLHN
jgi:NTP pyrophosphatase (non-canonical NTP hydrolase)